MDRLVKALGAAMIFASTTAGAAAPCEPSKYPPPYPWFIGDTMPGDRYAEIYLHIDKAGKPISCRMGKNNIPGDDKYFVCNAFIEQWKTSPRPNDPAVGPPPPNLPRNSPIVATVHRQLLSYGEKHSKAERQARILFFQQHPEERSECYPTGDEL